MNSHKAHIKNIKKANEENRLAIFIGSGVSKSSDNDSRSLPTWADLINDLQEDLSISDEVDYLKLAQLYYLEFEEPTYYQKIKSYFPEDIEPSDLHRQILDLKPHTIITTNWDYIIEKTIENGGYIYDVICSDKDLVKSTTQNKLIKMHGDFKNHNIVFKEDDYLDYSRNFPLIENYIKSTLSTHTVLFLGYSYNDINLKQIMKWIQSHSSSTPPMYLINFSENKPQETYLKNHGIASFTLDESKYPVSLQEGDDKRSKLIISFLKKVGEEDELQGIVDKEEVLEYFYNRLKHLKSHSAITLEQISNALTNCGYIYTDEGRSILHLYETKGTLTTDYSENTRTAYGIFVDILKECDLLEKDERKEFYNRYRRLNEILFIFSAANIIGVVINKTNQSSQIEYFVIESIPEYLAQEELDRKYLSFKYGKKIKSGDVAQLSSNSYLSYSEGDYESAFKDNAQLISVCKKNRIYSLLLIALFNRNVLLWRLKYSFVNNQADMVEGEIESNLQDEFFQFPKSEIKNNQVLYDFLSLNLVHRISNDCTRKLLELNDTVKTIQSGGLSFNSNADEPKSKHINYLMFSVKNEIMIENHSPFKYAMRDYVKISILRQKITDSISLNQYELYSAIKFFKRKELKEEFKLFEKNEDSNQLQLEVGDIASEWITSEVLPNLIELSIESKDIFNPHDELLQNCISILSFLNLNEDRVSKIMNQFSRLISSKVVSIADYESVNDFLAHQHHLFGREIDTDILIEILNCLINKISSRNAHGWDHHAITTNRINNLYGYIQVGDGKYTDKNKVEKLLIELQSYSMEDKRKFARSLLYNIFNISNHEVKNIISGFIQDIIAHSTDHDYDSCEFDLWSTAVDFKEFDPKVIPQLNDYLEQFRNGNKFSSALYSLKNLTEFLVNKKNINALKSIDDELLTIIEKHQNRPTQSYI